MTLIDIGSGPPIVLIPGIQGRWEYVRPAVDALATSFRTLTFPLCGERGASGSADPARGLDPYVQPITTALDQAGIERATICGISFGGLPAIRFASQHAERTSALILASVPGTNWQLRPRHRIYARAPWLFGPLFLAESPFRLHAELRSAFPDLGARWRFLRWQIGNLACAPLSPTRMAGRAAVISSARLRDDCARVTAPTLIVTGERDLDRVVSVDVTREYVHLIAGARHTTLDRTGHLGSITRPDAFAAVVREFVDATRRVGRTRPTPDHPVPLREIRGPVGRLEALLDEPAPSTAVRAAVVFTHPHPQHGGTMHTKVVYQGAKALSRIGCAVLRFNFRGVGTSAGRFDDGAGEADDLRAGLDFMHQRHPDARLWAAGFSFGAWIALTVGAADPRVSTLIGIAPPLARYDFETVRVSTRSSSSSRANSTRSAR